ncbi:MAG: MFS transporter, partial [Actinobacteria bacterium]|nr:MFS transporter [Actinomycetota bacterium]
AYIGVVVTAVQGGMVGPLARRLGERRLAIVGMAALAIGLASLPAATSVVMLAVPLAILGFGQGTAVPALMALISRGAGSGEQGRLLGVSQSLSALGRVLGPAWGGVAFSRLGISAPYLSGAVIVTAALLLMLTAFDPMSEPR